MVWTIPSSGHAVGITYIQKECIYEKIRSRLSDRHHRWRRNDLPDSAFLLAHVYHKVTPRNGKYTAAMREAKLRFEKDSSILVHHNQLWLKVPISL